MSNAQRICASDDVAAVATVQISEVNLLFVLTHCLDGSCLTVSG
jgi:hypothetical protein